MLVIMVYWCRSPEIDKKWNGIDVFDLPGEEKAVLLQVKTFL